MHKGSLFLEELKIDSATFSLFKDKTKPFNFNKFPEYPGQQVAGIKFPMLIKKVTVKNGTILNKERRPDGTIAKVSVTRIKATVENITTLPTDLPLSLSGDAWLENAANFKLKLVFDYKNPQFSIDATISKFDLTKLNTLLKAYTPALVDSGFVDEITMSGTAYKTKGVGTMKFLYHDLQIDLQLKKQAQWKSDIGAFAANTLLNSSNPVKPDVPPRIVKYETERNRNKGFINIVLKSLLTGLKETLIPSKENRKMNNEKQKTWRKKQKAAK
jgi:hypothetical protein